jgi:dihydroxyacetone kinase phosphotransfer subunit
MIGIVVISHSSKLAEGVKDLAEQMAQGKTKVIAAGGLDDETIGTNAERILAALNELSDADGILVMVDLGSAVMSAQVAIELLPEDRQGVVRISNAPLVEGSIIAAIEASIGADLDQVNAAAEATRELNKLK